MKNKIISVILFFISLSGLATPPDEGKNLFQARCAACHNVNKELTGPALAGIDQRRPLEWIVNFVHSSRSVISGGDKYAVALFDKFNKVPMPDHPDLSEENIKDIVAYINSAATAPVTENNRYAPPDPVRPGYLPLSLKKDYVLLLIYLGAVATLIATLLFAVQFTRTNNRQLENSANKNAR